MPTTAANLASPRTAAELAAAALASRRADPVVRGRVMVRRPLLSKAVPVTQLAGAASTGQPSAPLVQLPVGKCCPGLLRLLPHRSRRWKI
jgi:hypothetical protein